MCWSMSECLCGSEGWGDEGLHAREERKNDIRKMRKQNVVLLWKLAKDCENTISLICSCYCGFAMCWRHCSFSGWGGYSSSLAFVGAFWLFQRTSTHTHTHKTSNSLSTGLSKTLTRWSRSQPFWGPPAGGEDAEPRYNCNKLSLLSKSPSPAPTALSTSKYGYSDEPSAVVPPRTRRHAPPSLLSRSRRPRKR